MICPICQSEISNDSVFCSHCGSKISFSSEASAQTQENQPFAQNFDYANQQPSVSPLYTSVQQDPKTKGSGLAIASLVLGICSFGLDFLFFLPSILGIIFGCLGLKSKYRGLAIAGIVTSIISIVLTIGFFVLAIIGAIYYDAFPYYYNYYPQGDFFSTFISLAI